MIEDENGPPVLHRRVEKSDSDNGSNSKDKDKDQQKAATAPAPPTAAPPAGAQTPPSPPTSPDTAKPPASPEPAKTSAPASASEEPIEDPNRPRLRRGKPPATAHAEPFATFDALDVAPGASSAAFSGTGKPDAAVKGSSPSQPQIVVIPAISDAGGPDPRPYTYDVKPEEEASYREKMLDLAAAQLRAKASTATKEAAPTRKRSSANKSAGKSAGKPTEPVFDDVRLRIFDLSSSNEPVLALSAKARPPAEGATGNVEEPQEITLIARTNLEGDLQKLFFSQTDSQHLDVTPRMELIDAVDADGDGRGELLFRRTFDDGNAYAIYRVTADGLWPLYEPTP